MSYSDPFGLAACDPPDVPCNDLYEHVMGRFRAFVNRLEVRAAAAVGSALGEATGLLSTIRFFSGRDLDGTQLSAGERAVDGVDVALAAMPGGTGRKAVTRLTSSQATDLATYLGFRRVKDAPFHSHGQPVFSNGNIFITPDVDAHKGGVWKVFNRKGGRVGTYDAQLVDQVGH